MRSRNVVRHQPYSLAFDSILLNVVLSPTLLFLKLTLYIPVNGRVRAFDAVYVKTRLQICFGSITSSFFP